MPLVVVEGDEEGIVLTVGRILNAQKGVDLAAGGAFLGRVVVEGFGDVGPPGGGFGEAQEGGLAQAEDDFFIDALDGGSGGFGVGEPALVTGPIVRADG